MSRHGLKYSKTALARQLLQTLRCVEGNELREWVKVAPDGYEFRNGMLRLFCEDCMPAYRREMEAQGRCVAATGLPLMMEAV